MKLYHTGAAKRFRGCSADAKKKIIVKVKNIKFKKKKKTTKFWRNVSRNTLIEILKNTKK